MKTSAVCLMNDATTISIALAIGSRVRVRSLGKFSRGLDGRTGTVVGFAHTRSAVRVVLDGQKYPQTLHCSYLQPFPEIGA